VLKSSDGVLVLSATDLTNHLGCLHLTQQRRAIALGLRAKPAVMADAHADLVRERGIAYEAEVLERLAAAVGGDYVNLSAHETWTADGLVRGAVDTEAAMRSGVALIYQATFFDGRWQGRTDFLRRVEAPSDLGPYSYVVIDTKLARDVKPYVVHQLCLYNRLLGEKQGLEPDDAFVILGNGDEVRVELHRYRALHRHTARLLERAVDRAPIELYPEPTAHCGICSLDRECDARRRADDHLSLVAGARRDYRAKLVREQIDTVALVAAAAPEREIAELSHQRFEVLRHQAALQVESRTTHLPTRRQLRPERQRGYALLPMPSPGDIFFDLEGDPYVGTDGGIEYLWGWTNADGSYHCRWAHDEHEERAALCEFIGVVQATRAAYPGMHVFHYAAHEKSKLRSLAQKYGVLERAVDEWLRTDVLVDLFAVVRQGLQVGEEGYSLKQLERHHAFQRKERAVREGGGSIIAYESWLKTRDPSLLESIRAYNEEDCESTASLYRWLLGAMRPEAAAEYGVDFDELAKPAADEKYAGPTWLPDVLALIARLHEGLPELAEDDDDEQSLRRLLGELVLYHYRESKPQYWTWFDLKAKTPIELVLDREAIGLIELDRSVAPIAHKSSLDWTYRIPLQETKLSSGTVMDPATDDNHILVRVGEDHVVLRRGRHAEPPQPTALIARQPPDGKPMREALCNVAECVLDRSDRFHTALALLRRESPRLRSGELGPEVEQLVSATLGLDRSVLPVQGPPGTGKTYRGARMIVAALQAGQRVAVCAFSHGAIQNLLHAIEECAHEAGFAFRGVYKPKDDDPYASPHELIGVTTDNAETLDESFQLVAGTSWLLSLPGHRERFGTVFIDEAGQFSLASAVAVAPCAECAVLLGDPQQLPQVNQASHPYGAGASVLEHLLGGHDTVQEGCGVLLDESWRMHPSVTAFVSEGSYDGKLRSRDACSLRRVDSAGAISGAGLRCLGVDHAERVQDSPEEADAIAAACRDLLADGTVTDEKGATRRLLPRDIMVVAPYNMAVARIRRAVPEGVRVGTVDMFQGREAAVVFFAMTCSTGEDVPRGLDFLFSRNRFNVAISRAQCIAVLVHSPRLLDADCQSLSQMALVDGVCRFVEMSSPAASISNTRPTATT
jgi:predicted RecB family nuclease